MAHEILSIKLCELEEQLSRLSSRIYLSETADHAQLQQEIKTLLKENAETKMALQRKLGMSKAEMVTILASSYTEIEEILRKAERKLQVKVFGQDNKDEWAEEKILLAEYALDFAIQDTQTLPSDHCGV